MDGQRRSAHCCHSSRIRKGKRWGGKVALNAAKPKRDTDVYQQRHVADLKKEEDGRLKMASYAVGVDSPVAKGAKGDVPRGLGEGQGHTGQNTFTRLEMFSMFLQLYSCTLGECDRGTDCNYGHDKVYEKGAQNMSETEFKVIALVVQARVDGKVGDGFI